MTPKPLDEITRGKKYVGILGKKNIDSRTVPPGEVWFVIDEARDLSGPTPKPPITKPEWEKEWDEKYATTLYRGFSGSGVDGYATCGEEIKAFISDLLKQQKQELVGKIETRRKTLEKLYFAFKLDTDKDRIDELDQVISLIQEE